MFSNPLARAIRRSVAGTSRREKVSQKPVLVRPEGQTIELRALAPVQPGEVKM